LKFVFKEVFISNPNSLGEETISSEREETGKTLPSLTRVETRVSTVAENYSPSCRSEVEVKAKNCNSCEDGLTWVDLARRNFFKE